jgi:hypothetical protein
MEWFVKAFDSRCGPLDVPASRSRETSYRPQLAEAAYWLVAVGTAGRVLGELP